ncbi:MAG: hypothetical protein IT159_02330 [Bryobacterales bacterium]|nr:hypothetical protein [Bryobacterales bacterium]
MKGDFTRFTFDAKKHYTRVLKQQGRPDLDADWNEQNAIQNHLLEESHRDTIGKSGFPKGPAFSVQPTPDATDLVIQPGHAYVDGILAVFEGTAPVSYRNQPDYVQLPALAPVQNQTDLVYLDVWQRHITGVEDGQIREPALGGIDTATRSKTIAQVRIQPNVATTDCAAALAKAPERPGGGRLTTSTAAGSQTPSSCLLPPVGGYRGLENRLYRVEIHAGGDLSHATFKWSRDNGAVVFPVAAFLEPAAVQLSSLGRDQILTIHKNDWVEVLGDQTELKGEAGTLVQVLDVDPQTRKLTLSADISAHSGETHPKVRRWDNPAGAAGMNSGQPILLEDGIEVQFSLPNALSPFRSGDYWLFTARTGAAGLELLNAAPARGVKHHLAALALITWNKTGPNFTPAVKDCRRQFPPLTAIAASDVSFDNSVCQFPGAATVQDAINALCKKGCCALTADPGPGWERVFDKLPPQGGIICLRPEEYSLATTVEVKDKGPIVLIGAGESSKIVVTGGECAIRFVNCGAITLRGFAARAQSTGRGNRGQGPDDGIRGVFDFSNCWNVTVEDVVLTCASGPERAAACLSVHGSAGRDFEVRVNNCRLKAGSHQDGILVLNAARVWISNNTIEGTRTAAAQLPALLTNPASLSELRKPLLSKLFVKQPPAAGVVPNVRFPARNPSIQFTTMPGLVAAWDALLKAANLDLTARPLKLRDKVIALANRLLRDNHVAAFQGAVNQIRAAYVGSSQGIVVGGLTAGEVRIDGNVITGFAQGIHVGLSKSGPRTGGNVRRAGRVEIRGNSVALWIGPGWFRERHGVFVGNADSILVQANSLALARDPLSAALPVDGIRIFGYFGRYIMVRDNHIPGFGVGIRITPRGTEYTRSTRFWRVADNAVLSAAQSAVIAPQAIVS